MKNYFLSRTTKFVIFLLLLISQSNAQDTLEYYPVNIGNYWEYWFLDIYQGWVGFYQTITKDTLMPNGKVYKEIKEKSLTGIWDPRYIYFRAENNKIYRFIKDTTRCPEREFVFYDFIITDSVYWHVCNFGDSVLRSCLTYNLYYDIFSKEIETKHTIYAAILNGDTINLPFGLPCPTTIAKGVGMVREWRCDDGDYKLEGAIINGITYGNITGVRENNEFAFDFSLEQNYPNPFNPSTKINFNIKKAGNVKLEVFDIYGSRVAILVDGIKQEGEYSMVFDGSRLASGVYVYRLQTGDFISTRKMVLLR